MPANPLKPKRDWLAIRKEFETGAISYRKLAARLGIPESTLNCRIMREGWISGRSLVRRTAKELDAKLQTKMKARIEAELAPFIEAEKVKFTKRGIKLAKKGLTRVETFFRSSPDIDPKSDAMIAKAGESWHRVGRTALGMNDGSAVVTPLTLNLLGSHQAIQINAPNEPDSKP